MSRVGYSTHLRSTPVQIADSLLGPPTAGIAAPPKSIVDEQRRALRRRTTNLRAHGSGQTEAGPADQGSHFAPRRSWNGRLTEGKEACGSGMISVIARKFQQSRVSHLSVIHSDKCDFDRGATLRCRTLYLSSGKFR